VPDGLTFTVLGDPVPWARADTRGSQRFTPAKQREYMLEVQWLARRAMREAGVDKLDGAVILEMVAIWSWPATISRASRPLSGMDRKATRPDASNIVKLVEDALNGIAFTDDARISDLHVYKRYGDTPGVTVTVRPA